VKQCWGTRLKKTQHTFRPGNRVRELLTDRLGTVTEVKTYQGIGDKLLVELDTGYQTLLAVEFFVKSKVIKCID
jgi:hypothetical protein